MAKSGQFARFAHKSVKRSIWNRQGLGGNLRTEKAVRRVRAGQWTNRHLFAQNTQKGHSSAENVENGPFRAPVEGGTRVRTKTRLLCTFRLLLGQAQKRKQCETAQNPLRKRAVQGLHSMGVLCRFVHFWLGARNDAGGHFWPILYCFFDWTVLEAGPTGAWLAGPGGPFWRSGGPLEGPSGGLAGPWRALLAGWRALEGPLAGWRLAGLAGGPWRALLRVLGGPWRALWRAGGPWRALLGGPRLAGWLLGAYMPRPVAGPGVPPCVGRCLNVPGMASAACGGL